MESKDNQCVLLANHREEQDRWVSFCACGGVKQGPCRYEVWEAKERGKNIPIRKGNRQNAEVEIEKQYRNEHFTAYDLQNRARQLAHVESFTNQVLCVLESGYQDAPPYRGWQRGRNSFQIGHLARR